MISTGFGWRPSPQDSRDRPFGLVRDVLAAQAAAPQAGAEYRIQLHRPARDQVGSSCTANAWCGAVEIRADLEGRALPNRAAQGLYWCERQRTGDASRDGGAWLRCGAESLRVFGVGPIETCPDNPATILEQPDPRFFVEGADCKLSAYYAIDEIDPLDDIEIAVRADHPVVFGVYVGPDFVHYDGAPSTVFDPPTAILGGHAMIVVGVRGVAESREFLWRTSWGAWGINGFGVAWASAKYMRTALDIWVATSAVPL